jgi:hypothetical protein
LIIGDKGSNEYLQSLGFEQYSDLFDYGFDSIMDNHNRLNAALEQVKRVYTLGANRIKIWYRDNIEKIKKNKERFFEFSFSKMIDETIEELKEY